MRGVECDGRPGHVGRSDQIFVADPVFGIRDVDWDFVPGDFVQVFAKACEVERGGRACDAVPGVERGLDDACDVLFFDILQGAADENDRVGKVLRIQAVGAPVLPGGVNRRGRGGRWGGRSGAQVGKSRGCKHEKRGAKADRQGVEHAW